MTAPFPPLGLPVPCTSAARTEDGANFLSILDFHSKPLLQRCPWLRGTCASKYQLFLEVLTLLPHNSTNSYHLLNTYYIPPTMPVASYTLYYLIQFSCRPVMGSLVNRWGKLSLRED